MFWNLQYQQPRRGRVDTGHDGFEISHACHKKWKVDSCWCAVLKEAQKHSRLQLRSRTSTTVRWTHHSKCNTGAPTRRWLKGCEPSAMLWRLHKEIDDVYHVPIKLQRWLQSQLITGLQIDICMSDKAKLMEQLTPSCARVCVCNVWNWGICSRAHLFQRRIWVPDEAKRSLKMNSNSIKDKSRRSDAARSLKCGSKA